MGHELLIVPPRYVWYGPAVEAEKPGPRERIIDSPEGRIVRRSSPASAPAGSTAAHTNLARVSTATDPALESAAWDLEPLVDGRGAPRVEQLLADAPAGGV